MYDRAWIAAHIPHQGSMCLLDSVESWNDSAIICRATSHRQPDNALRSNGRLGILNGIEYAAQAMAVHGAILSGDDKTPEAGYLVSVRDIRWQCARLDDLEGELRVQCERISGNPTSVLYRFGLNADGRTVLSGRASVLLEIGKS